MSAPPSGGGPHAPAVVRVVPAVSGVDREFDYLVPAELVDRVRVGTIVRVRLRARRVRAWVVAVGVDPVPGVELRPLDGVVGEGPPPGIVELTAWGAWRWAGRRNALLTTASPPRVVERLPPPPPPGPPVPRPLTGVVVDRDRTVVRLPPAADPFDWVLAVCARGPALIVVPSAGDVGRILRRLRRAGVQAVSAPDGWAEAAAGRTLVGTRAAAWHPVGDLAGAVVLDEHDEALAQEQAPTWSARDVVTERCARSGVPCVLVSPVPTLEALRWGDLRAPDRAAERSGWPAVDVVDRRDDPPGLRSSPFSERFARVVSSGARVVCVVNRKGRARLVACDGCGTVMTCVRCGARVAAVDERLVCARCEETRPVICPTCGSTRTRQLRLGVTRLATELAALAREPVDEVTAETRGTPGTRLVVGTEAALHRVTSADVVAFLDFDQELLAHRYRAAEQALALVARAGRLVGGRRDGGRVLIQTRLPDHEVIRAAVLGDPGRLSRVELERRRLLELPPFVAMAAVSGPGAPAVVTQLGGVGDLRVLGPRDGTWLVKAPDHPTLCDALASVRRPAERVRIAVDPLRI